MSIGSLMHQSWYDITYENGQSQNRRLGYVRRFFQHPHGLWPVLFSADKKSTSIGPSTIFFGKTFPDVDTLIRVFYFDDPGRASMVECETMHAFSLYLLNIFLFINCICKEERKREREGLNREI